MVISLELARRLERVDALNSADYALTLARLEPASHAALIPLGPGYALRMGPDYPINKMAWLEAPDPRSALRTLLEPLKAKAPLLAEQKAVRVRFSCTVEAAGAISLEFDPDALALLARLGLHPAPVCDPSNRPLN
jgi:hypothetical protein